MALNSFFFGSEDILNSIEIFDCADDCVNNICAGNEADKFGSNFKRLTELLENAPVYGQKYFVYILMCIVTCADSEYYGIFQKTISEDIYADVSDEVALHGSNMGTASFYYNLLQKKGSMTEQLLSRLAQAEEKEEENGWGNSWRDEMDFNIMQSLNYNIIKFAPKELMEKCAGNFLCKNKKKSSAYLYIASKQHNKEAVEAMTERGVSFEPDSQGFLMLCAYHGECITDFLLPQFGERIFKGMSRDKKYTLEEFFSEYFNRTDRRKHYSILCAMEKHLSKDDFDRLRKFLPPISYVEGEERQFLNPGGLYKLSNEDFQARCADNFHPQELTLRIKDFSCLKPAFLVGVSKLSRNIVLDLSEMSDYYALGVTDLMRLMNGYKLIFDGEGIPLFVEELIKRDKKNLITKAFEKGILNSSNYREAVGMASRIKSLNAMSALAELACKIDSFT